MRPLPLFASISNVFPTRKHQLWQRLPNHLQGGAFLQDAFLQDAFPKDMFMMRSCPISELSYSRVMPDHGSHHPGYLSAVDM